MARAVWTGSITFGLVTVPVGLFPAVSEHDIRFNQLQRGTADRIRYKRVNERTGDEVPVSEIVKGREVVSGQYVVVTQDELDALAPGRSHNLEVSAFVDLREVDPVFFAKTYWLGPANKDAVKPYALLAEAMTRTNKVAIGTLVMRSKEHLAAIRATNGVLALHTLYFADEVRAPRAEIDLLGERVEVGERETSLATQLVDAMTQAWEPESYHDTYAEQVESLLAAKADGREVVVAEEAPVPSAGGDLLTALLASLGSTAAAGTPGTEESAAPKPARRRAKPAPAPASLDDRRQAAADRLAKAPKAELERWARQLGIAGRSTMTVAQLRQAVADAGGPPRRRRVS